MKLKAILLTAFLVMSTIITGCSTSNDELDIGTWSITVEIAGQAPFEFTQEDAMEIGPVEIKASVKDADTLLEEETWRGILLSEFLEYIGVENSTAISIEGKDEEGEYNIRQLDPTRIDWERTGLGWMVNGEMLDEERGPIQLINHNRGPKWWVRQVTKIEIIL